MNRLIRSTRRGFLLGKGPKLARSFSFGKGVEPKEIPKPMSAAPEFTFPTHIEEEFNRCFLGKFSNRFLIYKLRAAVKFVWVLITKLTPSQTEDPTFRRVLYRSLAFAVLSKLCLIAVPLCIKFTINLVNHGQLQYAMGSLGCMAVLYSLTSHFEGLRRLHTVELFHKSWFTIANRLFRSQLESEKDNVSQIDVQTLEEFRIAMMENFQVFFNFYVTYGLELLFSFTLIYTQVGGLVLMNLSATIGAYLLLSRYIERKEKMKSLKSGASDSEIARFVEETLFNQLLIKLYDSSALKLSQFSHLFEQRLAKKLAKQTYYSKLYSRQKIVLSIGLFINSMMMINMVGKGGMSTGDVIFINSLAIMLFTPMFMMSVYTQQFTDTFPTINKMLLKMRDVEANRKPKYSEAVAPLVIKHGNIDFENVTIVNDFGNKLIENASFRIPGGKLTLITGVAGIQKSLLIKAILRKIELNQGKILIDGQDTTTLNQKFRNNFSYMPSEHFFSADTIFNNIIYASPTNYFKSADSEQVTYYHETSYVPTLDKPDDKILSLVAEFRLDRKIESLPNGYNTLLGEKGSGLTVNERQRLSLVRTFLRNTHFYLFEQPTAFLDPESESHFMEKVFQLVEEKKTVIVLSHDLQLAPLSDQIICLGDNGLVEVGSHSQLYLANKKYYSLFKSYEIFDVDFDNDQSPGQKPKE